MAGLVRVPAGTSHGPIAGRRSTTSRDGRAVPERAKNSPPRPIKALLIALVIPWIIPVGSINLSAYRIVLLVLLVPCLIGWIRGRAGRVRGFDIGLLLFSLWAGFSFVAAHGFAAALQPAGILFIETMGTYLLIRLYIRDADDFRNTLLTAVKIMLVLLPFAVYEWLTSGKPILVMFGKVFPTVEITLMQPRMGFWRVQGPFSHSIEFGLFCASMVAMTHLALGYGRGFASRWLLTGSVAFSAFLSMSSAPIAAFAVQVALIAWNCLLRDIEGRWKIMWFIAFAGYLAIEFGSNQTPIQFYISHFTFDRQTGWYRIWIWNHGSASVLNHPLLGIGMADWVRPSFMVSNSVDNFWLLNAMRHGIPALALLLGSSIWITFAVARKKILDERLVNYRIAYIICMTAFFFVGSTIHFAGAIYVWFILLLGSGVWLLDVDSGEIKLSNSASRINKRDGLFSEELVQPSRLASDMPTLPTAGRSGQSQRRRF